MLTVLIYVAKYSIMIYLYYIPLQVYDLQNVFIKGFFTYFAKGL